ncbi:MAG: hypothetical protein QM831_32515 [Kofleriaceae bacterium]
MRLPLALLLVAACGSDVPGDDTTSPDAPASMLPPGYQTLISQAWTLAPNTEKYLCVRQTATTDTYIKSIRPIAPTGSHHAVLMITDNSTVADGTTDCTSMLPSPAIYASGVGTNEFDFPDGVGLHIKAGQQLFLNLHLFNTGEVDLAGTSGVAIIPTDAASIQHEAASILIGAATKAEVPVGLGVQLRFQCATPANTTVFAVAPHMHLTGAHLTETYVESGNTNMVLDTDYSFDDQHFRSVTPFTTTAGGKIQVTCTYNNDGQGANPIPFGESTTQEMCFGMTYVYPPPGVPGCGTEISI